MSTELPEDWSWTRVYRVASVNARIGWKALTASEYQSDGFAFLSTPNIKGREIDFRNVNFINEWRYNESPELKLQPGDVLLAKDGNTLGIVNLVERLPRPATVNGSIAIIRPSSMDPGYLRYVLASSLVQGEIGALKGGMGVPHLFQWDINRLRLPQPPLEEQRRIADFLDAETSRIDQLAEVQTRALELLVERESATRDLGIDALAQSAGCVELRRFVWSVDQGSSPQCDQVPAADGEWGVLKVSSLRPGVFDHTQNKRLPEFMDPDVRGEVREGDLLITRANTPMLVGSTAVVGVVPPRLLLSDKIFRVRLVAGMDPRFIMEVAAGSRIRALCGAVSNGASQSMANIRFEEVKSWPIPAAGIDEQMAFVNHMQRLREKMSRLKSAISKQSTLLAERRQALITAAVTGQLDVTTASG